MPEQITPLPFTYYPPKEDETRLLGYEKYQKMFDGEHFEAFEVKKQDIFEDLKQIEYIIVNFAEMISKLNADMLFEEFPKITLPDGDNEFMDSCFYENNLRRQIYESGLENSYRGDAVFRIRAEDSKLIIEDINPSAYFPVLNEQNTRAEPKEKILMWTYEGKDLKTKINGTVLRVERHTKGWIVNEAYLLKGKTGEIGVKLPYNDYFDGEEVVDTKINEWLIIEIPNYSTNNSYWGISDYKSLISAFNAINKRKTKIDEILDKHGDPILAVPDGVLDEDGQVQKKKFGVIEVDTGEDGGMKPEYIVWDAKLESAFREIEDLTKDIFLTSETSQALFGMDSGGGQAESGRALKFRLIRTIAKKHRKEIYYTDGLTTLFYNAQLFAKANGLKCGDKKLSKEPTKPVIEWQDGVINDMVEVVEIETTKINNDLQTKAGAIAVIEGITQDEAEERVEKIDEEKKKNDSAFGVSPFMTTENKKKEEEEKELNDNSKN